MMSINDEKKDFVNFCILCVPSTHSTFQHLGFHHQPPDDDGNVLYAK